MAQESQIPNCAVNICMKKPLGSIPSARSMSFSVASAQFSNLLVISPHQTLKPSVMKRAAVRVMLTVIMVMKILGIMMSSNLHMKMLEITSIKALKKLLSLFL